MLRESHLQLQAGLTHIFAFTGETRVFIYKMRSQCIGQFLLHAEEATYRVIINIMEMESAVWEVSGEYCFEMVV